MWIAKAVAKLIMWMRRTEQTYIYQHTQTHWTCASWFCKASCHASVCWSSLWHRIACCLVLTYLVGLWHPNLVYGRIIRHVYTHTDFLYVWRINHRVEPYRWRKDLHVHVDQEKFENKHQTTGAHLVQWYSSCWYHGSHNVCRIH